MSLCRWMGSPPVLQLRACWTFVLLPHAQIVAMPAGCQPYRSANASLNAPLCRANLCSSIGRVFNHAPAPCSCSLCGFRKCLHCFFHFAVIGLLVSQVYRFSSFICSASVSAVFSSDSPRMDWTRDLVMVTELENSCSASSVGIPIPSPPIFVGRLKNLLSA